MLDYLRIYGILPRSMDDLSPKGGPQIPASWKEGEEFTYLNIFRVVYEIRKNPAGIHIGAWHKIQGLSKDVRKVSYGND